METRGTTGEETTSYWFDLPIDVSEFEEKLGVGAESQEYRIIEKVLPYSSMDNLYFGKKFKVISTLLLAVLITIFNGIRNYTMYGEKYTGILDVHFLAVIGITFIS